MSLTDAAKALGLTENGVRTRFKRGKLRGERDNTGKLWVWVQPSQKPSLEKPSQTSQNELLLQLQFKDREIDSLAGQLADMRADRDSWRDQASRLLSEKVPIIPARRGLWRWLHGDGA
jgi:hypothetical protein